MLSQFRALAAPLHEAVDELSYLELQSIADDTGALPTRRYWKGHLLPELPDEALEVFLARGADGTAPADGGVLPYAGFQTYGGAIADVDGSTSAFSHRETVVEFVTAARWSDPSEDDARMAAARRYGEAMESFASGVYVNALSDDGQSGLRRAYPPATLDRLTALKDRYDPDNAFHLNHNILPSGTTAPLL